MGLLILYVALALVVSFICSILEAVLLSITPSHVAVLEREGSPAAEGVKALKADIEKPLSAILTLNTIAHTVGAAGAGAQAAKVFGDGSVWIFSAVAIFAAVLTVAILIFTEIIPKTLGAQYWRPLTPLVTRTLKGLVFVMRPIVWTLQLLTRLISRGEKDHGVSRDEIAAMADLGHQSGSVDAAESRILKSLFSFRSLRARDIMTPRTVLFHFQQDKTVGEVLAAHPHIRFSRIPIYGANRDDMVGYILKDDLLLQAARDQMSVPLRTIKREFIVVPDGLALPLLFERLLDKGEHIALVVDEYGGVAGIVSMEDIVETLLGLEIVDEADATTDMQVLARERWSKRARALGLLDDEDADPLSTPSGEAEAPAIVAASTTGTAQQKVRTNAPDVPAVPDPPRTDSSS
jgi:CBS domain containing-hemolysin-like protein